MQLHNDKFKNIENIIEIKELNLITDVNEHIKSGWKLLDTYKTTSANQQQTIHYCMGLENTNPKSTSLKNSNMQTHNATTHSPDMSVFEPPARRTTARKPSNKPRSSIYAL